MTRLSAGAIVSIPAVVLFGLQAHGEIRYRVREMGCNPETSCVSERAAGINNLGQVTGTQGGSSAFLWDPVSGWQTIPPGACGSISAQDINDLGHIVGTAPISTPSGGCVPQIFAMWTPDWGLIGLGYLPNSLSYSYGRAINNLDQCAGFANFQNQGQHAVFYSNETGIIDVGELPGASAYSEAFGINDLGWVVGESGAETGLEAFVWSRPAGMTGLGDLRGHPADGVRSSASDVNNLGEVVGYANSLNPPAFSEAFIWDAQNEMRGLGVLFNDESQGKFINDQSEVVGVSYLTDSAGQREKFGFVWDAKRGMRLLDALIDPCGGGSISHFVPQGMNDRGQIVGLPLNFNQSVILTPYVPGDLNGDNTVDLVDLAALLLNFGLAPAGYADGDSNCDQHVDLSDLAALLSNFGETYP